MTTIYNDDNDEYFDGHTVGHSGDEQGRTWANISHIFFMYDSIGIMLYGGDSSNAAVVVPCLSRQCALRVYAALASNAGRMGYPAKVVPADLVVQSERFVNDAAKESFMLKQAEAASMAGD